ncbi:cytochrome C [Rhodanobacter sp. MP7CTX1]|uniref:c-type cytochrome n=1 Tax=Rhodanobacter sp. MP7CTX1 TaxID=2723084 RepID=UPI00160EAEA1|nr:cytochrome C [Rhodanobacter sp. MP7CTX1]MBB6189533.1 cytochrome c553 [Rhodanobacter sp. MP7CTX1]
MPKIVITGRGEAVPCSGCHAPTGAGMPHTASLTGLPAGYILEQLKAFGDGSRANGDMHAEALSVSDADLQQAAAYFCRLRLASGRAQIIQAAWVPKTHIESWMLVPAMGGGIEAIGDRVIELPVNAEDVRMGDARARFVAYVPPGSIARGRLLVSTGAGETIACTACHGADLRGVANIPPLAGRSPTYITRQLVQFALGNRRGEAAAPMQQEVLHLTLRDMIAAAAYAASLEP